MFKTIVWATDGSEHADSALAVVTELARVHKSQVVAVHIDERFRGGRFGGGAMFADEDELLGKIKHQVDELGKQGVAARFEHVTTERHDTSALVAEAAALVGADLIVVGTRGHGEFEAVLVGSVARGLTHDARCPVLVVPPSPVEVTESTSEGDRALAGVGPTL